MDSEAYRLICYNKKSFVQIEGLDLPVLRKCFFCGSLSVGPVGPPAGNNDPFGAFSFHASTL